MAEKIVANPGSTLGEAIGTLVELEVNRLLRPIVEENGGVYITAGPASTRTGQPTKLLLRDAAGIEYQIDAIEFLSDFDEQEMLHEEHGLSLWPEPAQIDKQSPILTIEEDIDE